MGRSGTAKRKTPAPAALIELRQAVSNGDDWFSALLAAIGRWELP